MFFWSKTFFSKITAELRNLGTTFDRQEWELNMLRKSLLMQIHFMIDFKFFGGLTMFHLLKESTRTYYLSMFKFMEIRPNIFSINHGKMSGWKSQRVFFRSFCFRPIIKLTHISFQVCIFKYLQQLCAEDLWILIFNVLWIMSIEYLIFLYIILCRTL